MINDANEGGVAFARDEYSVETSEATRVGEALVALRAGPAPTSTTTVVGPAPATARLLYGIHATRSPGSAALFRLHELSGVLELAQPLDRYLISVLYYIQSTAGQSQRKGFDLLTQRLQIMLV